MVKKRAEKAKKPRKVKTWRIREDVIKKLSKLSQDYNRAESEIIEFGILKYEENILQFIEKLK